MTELKWTSKALSDLARLHEFLDQVNPQAAAAVVRSLTTAAGRLVDNPHIGRRLRQYDPREVRRVIAGRYEMRYEITGTAIYILRLWHTREDR